jgi:hypothetical protein
MRLKLLGCEILSRELCDAVSRSPHQVDVAFLPKALHDLGRKTMAARIQDAVDTVAACYDAILLGYGLCGNGILGLRARSTRIVIPRVHDCISLLMGSRHRFAEYFASKPGAYFRSTGWVERAGDVTPLARDRTGAGHTLDGLVERYGEENGRYIFEELNRFQRSYTRLTYIETGLEPDRSFEIRAREEAASRNWKFEKVRGDLRLFHRLVNGEWDSDEFVVVPPGHRVCARHDSSVLDVEKCP